MVEDMMKKALEVAHIKGYEVSRTEMYRCEVHEYTYDRSGDEKVELILDVENLCAICVFIEDEPYNWDSVKATTYDGDCDCCGRLPSYLED